MFAKIKFISITTLCVLSALFAFSLSYTTFKTPRVVPDRHEGRTTQTEQLEPLQAQTEIVRNETNMYDDMAAEYDYLAPVFTVEDKINENTDIEYEYFFAEDGKTKTAVQKAPVPLIGLTRKQLMEKVEGWRVVSFSSEKVELRKVIEATPTGTYILGIWNDHVAVFHGGQTSGTGLMEVTDTPVSSLSQEEHELLSEGIIIESEAELIKVLEDYGS